MRRFLKSPVHRALVWLSIAAIPAPLVCVALRPFLREPAKFQGPEQVIPMAFQLEGPDAFDGGAAWINSGPIKLKELKGKIVLVDFWTYCCINCHHVLPDLARLEEKYKNELVVIGVHTPKFIAERDTENVRRKVREYGIKHPVVCDSDQIIWNRFGVSSWPTLVLFGPDGKPFGAAPGEGNYDILDRAIGELAAAARAKGALNETPFQFFPENERPDNTPLLFPGKVLADVPGNRLFISDTGHHRIVMTNLDGKNPVVIGAGTAGLTDGGFDKARFNRQQGMVLIGETLYVADTENHAIRAIDLKSKTVSTVAGTGEQSHNVSRVHAPGPGLKTALNSPWDLAHVANANTLYIAMAGPHQIWHMTLDSHEIGPWAGTGRENIVDGPITSAAFAQPSGLATDGTHLFVADSEVSAIRSISLLPGKHQVQSIVGEGLFEFGDIDGRGADVRLQHCLGVSYADGKLFIADTYNNKIKVCDPKLRAVKSFAGTGKPGDIDSPALFYQPGGLSVAGSKLYVADTNNHKIRVVNLEDASVSTLTLEGLTPPVLRPRTPTFPNAEVKNLDKVEVAPGKALLINVTLPIPAGYKLNTESTMPILVEAPGKPGAVNFPPTGQKLDSAAPKFSVKVPLADEAKPGDSLEIKVSVGTFVCNEGSNLCTIKSFVWKVPVAFAEGGAERINLGSK